MEQQQKHLGRLRLAALWLGLVSAVVLAVVNTGGSNPNHTPKEILYAPQPHPARHLCVDRDGWLWWDHMLTIRVASDIDTDLLTPLDTWSGLNHGEPVCLITPRVDQSGVYALTTRGRLLSLSVFDSRILATEIANFELILKDACLANESNGTILASDWSEAYVIDPSDARITPISFRVPGDDHVVALSHAGGTRFMAAFLDGRISLLESQDTISEIAVANVPQFIQGFALSPDRARVALDIHGKPAAVSVRTSDTLTQIRRWQMVSDVHVSGLTWLDDRTLAISVLESTDLRKDYGQIVLLAPDSNERRRLLLDFEPWSILAVAPGRLAVADRDGSVRLIRVDR